MPVTAETEMSILSANAKANEKRLLNLCSMFIFSTKIITIKLNKLPIMEGDLRIRWFAQTSYRLWYTTEHSVVLVKFSDLS